MACQLIVDSSKVAIEKSRCSGISRLLSSRKPDEEVELRFGFIQEGKNYSGISPDIDEARKKWYQLLYLLKGSYSNMKIEKTMSETYGSLRKITDLGVPSEPLIQDKKRLQLQDVLDFKLGDIAHTVRLVVSSEKNRKDVVPNGKPDMTRMRTRVSFFAPDGTHRIDLTYVTPSGYEVEIEYLKVVDMSTFAVPLKIVLHVLKGEKEVVSVANHERVIKAYNSFFLKEAKFDATKFYRRALPQPINLKRPVIPELTAYSATNKLNGTRMVGLVLEGELFLINMVGVVRPFATVPTSLNATLFDAEFFQDQVYGFDLLFRSGKDMRNLNLDERLRELQEVITMIKNPAVHLKKFYFSGDLAKDTQSVLQDTSNLDPEFNDGIIYTPLTETYFNVHIYKWKPPSMLTIDFLANKIGDNKYVLQVKDKTDKMVTFAPSGFNGTIISKVALKGVGEYKWTGKTFELVRPRPDKDIPNFIDTANDVWEDIQNPLEEEELVRLLSNTDEDRDAIRKYHNSIKRDLIDTYLTADDFKNGKKVLDLGAGRGGDLNKYQFSKLNTLYAVEPLKENLTELVRRASDMKAKFRLGYRLETLQAEAQQTNEILEMLKGTRVDAATMFFSLSFFFENNLSLEALLRTLEKTVEKNGRFIGTTIDGDSVRDLMFGQQEVNLGPVTIEKNYDDFKGKIGFGREITYIYKGSETVSEKQVEYLVDWDLFVERLAAIGFTLERSELFMPPSWMSASEKKVSRLYRNFIFKKTEKKVEQVEEKVKPKKHLPSAAVGKSFTFASVLTDELKEQGIEMQLVRTGTVANGDCFFHSVLTDIDAIYRKMDASEKTQAGVKFRKSFKITEEEWQQLGNGSVARIGSPPGADGFDALFIKAIESEEKTYMGEKIHINQAFGQYGQQNFIRKITVQKLANLTLNRFITEIENAFREVANPDHVDKAIKELNKIIAIAKEQAFKNYVSQLRACGTWVGQEVLETVGNTVGRDIFILNDTDGSAYRTECLHIENRKTILILYQGASHYESLGIQNGKVVQREFEPDHPLIQLIKQKIC